MNKPTLIFLLFVLAIGSLTFADQIAAVFDGMTPLEALNFIVTFILHVAVATIAAWVVFGLPEIVKPWLRMFRRTPAHRRRSAPQAAAPRGARLNKDQVLMWMASQMTKGKTPATTPDDPTRIDWDV